MTWLSDLHPAALVFLGAAAIMLLVAAVGTIVRLSRGPSTLDRVVAADVMLAIVTTVVALDAAARRQSLTIWVILVLALLGFAGSLSVARFVADRDVNKPTEAAGSAPTDEAP